MDLTELCGVDGLDAMHRFPCELRPMVDVNWAALYGSSSTGEEVAKAEAAKAQNAQATALNVAALEAGWSPGVFAYGRLLRGRLARCERLLAVTEGLAAAEAAVTKLAEATQALIALERPGRPQHAGASAPFVEEVVRFIIVAPGDDPTELALGFVCCPALHGRRTAPRDGV